MVYTCDITLIPFVFLMTSTEYTNHNSILHDLM